MPIDTDATLARLMDLATEDVARAIYSQWKGSVQYPWVMHGNSLKQGDARQSARNVLERTRAALEAALRAEIAPPLIEWTGQHGETHRATQANKGEMK